MSYRDPAGFTTIEYDEEPEPRDWWTIVARVWLAVVWLSALVGGAALAVFVHEAYWTLPSIAALLSTIAAFVRVVEKS